jgi:hypothetical protein
MVMPFCSIPPYSTTVTILVVIIFELCISLITTVTFFWMVIRILIYHLSVVVSPESLFALRTDPSGSESFEIAEVGPVELV